MKIVSISILMSLILFSCQKDYTSSESETVFLKNQKITINNIEREYHLYLPKEPAEKPLVILLHGHTGSFNQSLGFESSKAPQKVLLTLAEENEFILLVPNGTLGPEDTRGWNDCRNDAKGNPDSDDVEFLSQLLDNINEDYNYDTNRVYVTGISNGAAMAIRLVQEIPDKITAFASIVTNMPANSECPKSDVPVSALFMNGTDDPLVPYNGGQIASDRGLVQSTRESIDYWVGRNNTSSTAIKETLENVDNNDNSTVDKYTYTNGTNSTEVVLYKILGGGHTEPSKEERFGNLYKLIVGEQNGDIEMAHEVWDFFKTKSK